MRHSSSVDRDHFIEMDEKLCLVCLQRDQSDYCPVESRIGVRTILETINEIINFSFVDVDANFPRDICINCLNKLVELVDFKHQIQDSIKLFQTGVQFVTSDATFSRISESGYSTDPDMHELHYLDEVEVNELFHDDIILSVSDAVSDENVLRQVSEDVERRDKQEREEEQQQTTQTKKNLSFGEFIENLKQSSVIGPVQLKVRSDWTIVRRCKVCKKDFRNIKTLREHHMSEHPTVPLISCPICCKSFRSGNGLKFHVRTIHNDARPFGCEFPGCERRFALRKDLVAHAATHNKTVKAICDTCDRHFKSKQLLRRHFVNVHLSPRPYKCAHCYKSFTLRDSLVSHAVSHIPSHMPKKIHRCTKCDKAYRWRSDLTKHIRTHTGQRPYPCGICKKAYLCSSNLKRHSKEVHNITISNLRAYKKLNIAN